MPIDPAVFTLAGLGLNENQPVGLPGLDSSKFPLWRNGKVDHSYTFGDQQDERERRQRALDPRPDPPAPPAPPPMPGRGTSLTFVVGVVAGVLSVLTAVAAYVLRRRRRAAP